MAYVAPAPAPGQNVVPPQIINQAPVAAPPSVLMVNSVPQSQFAVPTTQFPPGSCRNCGGEFESRFTCCGIVWCILCFPIGLICLFTGKEKKCSACNRKA